MDYIYRLGALTLAICLLFQPALADELVPEPLPPVEETPAELTPEPLPELEPAPAEPAPEPVPGPITEEPQLELEPVIVEEVVPPPDLEYVPGEVIVKFKESSINLEKKSGEAKVEDFADAQGLELNESIEPANIALFETGGDAFIEAARLNENPAVEFAEPNYIQRIGAIDANDTDRALQWALENTGQTINSVTGTDDADIDAPEAWELSRGAGALVAVIDTGIDYTHPDLADNMWDGGNCKNENGVAMNNCIHGYDFYRDDNDPAPTHMHGTHVAGIIAAEINNGQGIIGVAPEAKLMALRTDFESDGETVLSSASIVRAIDFARENGANVINASFGSYASSTAMYDAIDRFGDAGGIFIAAAGNDTTNTDEDPFYPAAFDLPNVINVTSTGQNDFISTFSNYGTTTVDVAAPGRYIYSTVLGNAYEYSSGTSMAAPHVSGIAASLLAYNPTLTVSEIKDTILNTGDNSVSLTTTTATGKRVNLNSALTSLNGATSSALTVSLGIVNDNGRSATTSDVTFSVNGGSAQTFEGDGTNDLAILPARYYDITVSSLSDYTLSTSGCTDVALAAGETSACSFVYNDNAIVSSGGGGGGGGGGGKSKKKKKVTKKEVKKKEVKKKKTVKKPSTKPPVSPEMPRVVSAPLSYTAYNFTLDRGVGAQGPDVTELQKVLATKGFLFVAPTGYFGPMTQAALRQFQIANGIIPATGYLGPLTRAKLNLK